jgi:hypothetical protein
MPSSDFFLALRFVLETQTHTSQKNTMYGPPANSQAMADLQTGNFIKHP